MADTEKDSVKVLLHLHHRCVLQPISSHCEFPLKHTTLKGGLYRITEDPPLTPPPTHTPLPPPPTKLNAPSTSSSPSSPPHCYMPPTSPSFLAPLLCKDIAPLFSRLLFLLLTPSRSHHFSSSSSLRPALPYVSLSLSRPSLAFCHA